MFVKSVFFLSDTGSCLYLLLLLSMLCSFSTSLLLRVWKMSATGSLIAPRSRWGNARISIITLITTTVALTTIIIIIIITSTITITTSILVTTLHRLPPKKYQAVSSWTRPCVESASESVNFQTQSCKATFLLLLILIIWKWMVSKCHLLNCSWFKDVVSLNDHQLLPGQLLEVLLQEEKNWCTWREVGG